MPATPTTMAKTISKRRHNSAMNASDLRTAVGQAATHPVRKASAAVETTIRRTIEKTLQTDPEEARIALASIQDAAMWADQGEPFDLFWAARRDIYAEIRNNGPGAAACKRIVKEYKSGVDKLCDPERGDYTHGFNSGVVAFARLVLSLSTTEHEGDSDDEYPEEHWVKAERDAGWEEYPMMDS